MKFNFQSMCVALCNILLILHQSSDSIPTRPNSCRFGHASTFPSLEPSLIPPAPTSEPTSEPIRAPINTSSSPTLVPSSAPSLLPSVSPSLENFSCIDDLNFRYTGKEKKSCRWVGSRNNEGRRRRLCSTVPEVQIACPVSCGSCCVDDETFQFEHPRKPGKFYNCKSIERNGKWWCPKQMVDVTTKKRKRARRYCPKACERCRDPAYLPDEAPSPSISPSSEPSKAKSSSRPNILLILADDVGTGDIPYYWNTSGVSMPNIQQLLIEKGITFKNAHSTPLCAPSRYTLLSGNYPHRGSKYSGTWSIYNKNSKNQFLPRQHSIASILRSKAGYKTFMTGKYHLG